MLNCAKLSGKGSDLARYYAAEYYADQDGGAMVVHGKLARALNLADGQKIDAKIAARLLDGRQADGVQITTTKRRKNRTNGYDLTLSPDKSVSVRALTDARLVAAHERAATATMQIIESRYIRGRDASGTGEPGAGCWLSVTDNISRNGDPHLHTHAVLLNVAAHNGWLAALDGNEIMRADRIKLMGELYRQELRREVEQLGYTTSDTKDGWRLDCVSHDLCRELSTRRVEIEAAKARAGANIGDTIALSERDRQRFGVAGGEVIAKGQRQHRTYNGKVGVTDYLTIKAENGQTIAVDIAHSDKAAWALSRANKAELDPVAERARWRELIANSHTSSAAERARAARELAKWRKGASYSIRAEHQRKGGAQDERQAWEQAAERATQRQAWASREAIVLEYMRETRGVDLATAERRFAAAIQHGAILTSAKAPRGRLPQLYTSRELRQADLYCLTASERHAHAATIRADAAALVAAAQKADPAGVKLSDEQRAAVTAILSRRAGVIPVQGDAGAGKTTMMRALKQSADLAGIEVIGMSVAGKAAQTLEAASGIKSDTVAAALEHEPEPGSKPRIIVIDEASMLGSRDGQELLKRAAANGDKVVMIGDKWQLTSPDAGRPFDRQVERAEQRGDLIRLGENRRQKDPTLALAVADCKRGQTGDAIGRLDAAGRLREIADRAKRHATIAADYRRGDLVLTTTRLDRDALNAGIRQGEKAAGRITDERAIVASYKDDDGIKREKPLVIGIGDRVVFRETNARAGLNNGETGTVIQTKGGIVVKHDDGREIAIGDKYRSIDYGYALTTHAAQGQTASRVLIDAPTSGVMEDARAAYVQISRAKDDATIYTDSRPDLIESASKRTTPADTIEATPTADRTQPGAAVTTNNDPRPAQQPERKKETAHMTRDNDGMPGHRSDLGGNNIGEAIGDTIGSLFEDMTRAGARGAGAFGERGADKAAAAWDARKQTNPPREEKRQEKQQAQPQKTNDPHQRPTEKPLTITGGREHDDFVKTSREEMATNEKNIGHQRREFLGNVQKAGGNAENAKGFYSHLQTRGDIPERDKADILNAYAGKFTDDRDCRRQSMHYKFENKDYAINEAASRTGGQPEPAHAPIPAESRNAKDDRRQENYREDAPKNVRAAQAQHASKTGEACQNDRGGGGGAER